MYVYIKNFNLRLGHRLTQVNPCGAKPLVRRYVGTMWNFYDDAVAVKLH